MLAVLFCIVANATTSSRNNASKLSIGLRGVGVAGGGGGVAGVVSLISRAYHRRMRKLLTLTLLVCSACAAPAPTLTKVQADAIEASYQRDTDACTSADAGIKTRAEGQACLDAVKLKWGRK